MHSNILNGLLKRVNVNKFLDSLVELDFFGIFLNSMEDLIDFGCRLIMLFDGKK